MNFKLELSVNTIAETIKEQIAALNFDIEEIAETNATIIVNEIKNVICNESYSDFEVIEEIVNIFYKYGISTGGRHDFG